MIRVFNQYVSVKAILLIGLESVLIVMSLVLGAELRFWNEPLEFLLYTRSQSFLLQVLTALIVLETCCYYNELYDLSAARSRVEQIGRLVKALAVGCLLLGVLYWLVPNFFVSHGVLVIALVLTGSTMSAMRLSLDLVWRLTTRQRNLLVLGDGELALTVARELKRRDDLNCRIVGFVAPGQTTRTELLGHRIYGSNDKLYRIVRERRVSWIIVALDDLRRALPIRELERLGVQGIAVEGAHSVLASLTGRVWLGVAGPSWFVLSGGRQRSCYTVRSKRIIDIAFGLVGICLFSPVMALIAIAIRLDSRGPVLYRQTRVGLGGTVFNLVKFRSMQFDAEAENGPQWAQKEDPRVTRVGRWIRKYHLDEVPQFFNVLRGEMTFVGPRPERPVFVEQLRAQIPFYDERHSVLPGVTGWAQVQYTYADSAEDALRKLEYDLFYLKSQSLFFDVAIVFRTIRAVLFGNGR